MTVRQTRSSQNIEVCAAPPKRQLTAQYITRRVLAGGLTSVLLGRRASVRGPLLRYAM